MRLASYLVDSQPRAGVVAADQTLVAVSNLIAGGPTDMLAVLSAGPSLWDRVRAVAPSARGATRSATTSRCATSSGATAAEIEKIGVLRNTVATYGD
jgi:hypothetical protein